MAFKITEAEAREFARQEAAAGCDIGAGFDWGASLGTFLASANSYVDHEQLILKCKEISLKKLLHKAFGYCRRRL